MLYLVIACFAVALFAGASGFTAIAESATDLGWALLFAFVAIVAASSIIHFAQHRWSRGTAARIVARREGPAPGERIPDGS